MRRWIEPGHRELSIAAQCELLGLPRSSYYYEPAPVYERRIYTEPRAYYAPRIYDEAYYARPYRAYAYAGWRPRYFFPRERYWHRRHGW